MKVERLFFNLVNFVEIEISSNCNRSCQYCPQSIIKRKRELFPLEEIKKILIDMQSVNFDGALAFHQYNEPLLEYEHLCNCISLAKKYLPKAKLELFTNGDLLTKKRFKNLKKLGVNEFQITCQLNKDEEWNPYLAKEKVKKMKKKINYLLGKYSEDEFSFSYNTFKFIEILFNIKLYKFANIKKYPTLVKIQSENYLKRGSDRLNALKIDKLDHLEEKNCSYFCRTLIHSMNISYKGNAYLCWDCCEDTEEAIPYILGSIYDKNIFELYEKKLLYIKKYLFGNTPANCKDCYWNQK